MLILWSMNDTKDNERIINSKRTFMIFIFDKLLFSKNIQRTLKFRNKKINIYLKIRT